MCEKPKKKKKSSNSSDIKFAKHKRIACVTLAIVNIHKHIQIVHGVTIMKMIMCVTSAS